MVVAMPFNNVSMLPHHWRHGVWVPAFAGTTACCYAVSAMISSGVTVTPPPETSRVFSV